MLIKRSHIREIPKGAEIIEKRGRKYARWRARARTFTRPLNKTGNRIVCEADKWTVRIKLPNGQHSEWPAYTDRAASEALHAEKRAQIERGDVGLRDAYHEHRRRPLSQHLDAFEQHLAAKDNTSSHIEHTLTRCRALFDGIGAEKIGDIAPDAVQAWLKAKRDAGGTRPMSPSTSNAYLRAAKGFTRWLWRNRRSADNPLAGLAFLRVADHEKVIRRCALTEHELAALVETTARSPKTFRGLDGANRAALYATAAGTGFRACELASLSPEDFDLDATPPTIEVSSAYTKNAQTATQPIDPSLTAALRPWLAGKPDGKPVWPGSWPSAGAAMIRRDLEAADIPKTDGTGRRVDFHALRVTYVTRLTLADVHPRRAQELARHSDINLTMQSYTKLTIRNLSREVNKLGTPPAGQEEQNTQALRATGTDHAIADDGARRRSSRRTQRRESADLPCEVARTPDAERRNADDNGEGAGERQAPTGKALLPLQARHGETCRDMPTGPGGIRTRTALAGQGILSPLRLPVPPPGPHQAVSAIRAMALR